MGMAASQARYLGLTARKTNVEYEGQQVNQQRTALANESAGLFSQLMSLQVPIPPSISDFSNVQYTFNNGSNDCTITDIENLSGDPDYNSTVTYYYEQTAYTGIDRIRNDLGVNIEGVAPSTYWLTDGTVNKTKLTQCSAADPVFASDTSAIEQIIADTSSPAARTNFDTDYNNGAGIGNIYKYASAGGTTYYYSVTDLDALAATGTTGTLSNYYAADLQEKITTTTNAYLETADSGRYSSIQLEDFSTSFDVNTTTETDQNAYADAMNEYNYQQAVYEKEIQDINAKTETIQEEDRTLELRLRQLDTEQKALQTEMDAVKEVIKKNIESTFSTFK